MLTTTTDATETPVSPLVGELHSALESSPYVARDRVRIEAGEGHIKLHGNVGSFFEKQMAQEIVRRIDGVERIENLIQVAWA